MPVRENVLYMLCVLLSVYMCIVYVCMAYIHMYACMHGRMSGVLLCLHSFFSLERMSP